MKLAIFLAGAVFSLLAQAAPKTKPAEKPKANPFEQAHERVRDILKDPESARFRSEFKGKDDSVCGFVNAKNSYGGYDGFKPFIVERDRVQIQSSNPKEWWKMDSRWNDICSEFEPQEKILAPKEAPEADKFDYGLKNPIPSTKP